MTGLLVARLIWGLLLVTSPDSVGTAAGAPASPTASRVVRVLGMRHVLQALLTRFMPRLTVRRWGSAADALHAATCLALAAVDRRWRRAATLDALAAATWCVTTARRPRQIVR
ncbi:MAG: hypothetical protein JO285_04415 [Kutzneria sp.]|nr:hypothetical protein [Kutzneria sp.]